MRMSGWAWASLCLTGAWHAGEASAACNISYSAPFTVARTAALVVDEDLPTGALVRSTGADSATSSINCTERTTTEVSMELQGDGLVSGNVREITVGGQPAGLGIRLYARGPGDADATALPYRQTRSFPPGDSKWQTFFHAEYVRTGGTVRYGLADVAANARLGRIWIPDTTLFPHNRLIHSVTMTRLELIRPTCSIETGSLNQEVALGDYSAAELRNGRVTPDWRPFALTLGNCPDIAHLITDITFGNAADADAGDPTLFSMNQQGPGGYAIAIQTGESQLRMPPGKSFEHSVPSDLRNFRFRARLERTAGPITAGRINRPVVVRVTFR